MATSTKSVSGALTDLITKFGEHFERWAPILMLFGLVEHDKSGKPVPAAHTTKAGAHMMGFGTDDEAIIGSIIGEMKRKRFKKEAEVIVNWISILKKFQQRRLREVMAKKISEFKEIDEKTKNSKGMEYAIGFFRFLAGLTDDKTRTKLVIALNIITRNPSLAERTLDKAKKIRSEDLTDGLVKELRICNKTFEKFLLG